MVEPMSREQLIEHAKKYGVPTDKWDETHNPSDLRILGWHVYNESDAKVHVANISGVLIIYIEKQGGGKVSL